MEKLLFLVLCRAFVASAITLTPSAREFVSTNYSDPKASSVAIDSGRKLVYVTGGEDLNIFKLGVNDSMTHLKTQVFSGMKLGEVRWCANFISIITKNVADPEASTLEVYKVYNKKSGADMVAVNSVPLGAFPGDHRHSTDCKTVIVPISQMSYEAANGTTIDGVGAVKVILFSKANLGASYSEVDLNIGEFMWDESRLVSEGGLFEPTVAFPVGLEPSSVCLNANDTKAYVVLASNNLVATLDVASQTITALNGLGLKDFSVGDGFDPNDKNGIDITNYPIYAAYTPSAIECFTDDNGVDYFYTANEGVPLYRNLVRLNAVTLDPTVFPDTSFQTNANAGRLNIWGGGDTDADGDLDVVIVPGARSVSLFNAATMTLVADSGSDMELALKNFAPDFFNSDTKNGDKTLEDSMDFRSNNRGPEPRSLSVFSVCKDKYHIIQTGLEAPGGIVTFVVDATNMAAGFTFDNVKMSIWDYALADTWESIWTAQQATLLKVEGLALYPGRSPVLISASSQSSTVEAFRVRVKCSDL